MFSREAFLIYKSFYPAISDLTDEQLGRLFRSLFVYQIDNIDCQDNDIIMAFRFFKNQFRLDDSKYEKVVNRNKSNGSKGGRPKTQNNPKNPVGFQEPKKPDNDKDNVNDKENDNNHIEVIQPRTAYQMCIDFWLLDFHPSWTFEAVHGKSLKSLIRKIQTLQKDSGKDVTDESIFAAFKFICVNLPEFFKDKDLQILNSKFNEIIEQIKNKSNGRSKNESQYRG